MPSASGRPSRAPALYVTGSPGAGESPIAFRLPCPPAWDDRPPVVRAAERRARKAYFAALDALYRGQVNEDAAGKLRRLVTDVRSLSARAALEHLLRVFNFVRRGGASGPVLVAPPAPCERVAIGVPGAQWTTERERLAERYAWPLEWLRMHRFLAGKSLVVDWYPLPEAAGVVSPVRPIGAQRSRRGLRGAA